MLAARKVYAAAYRPRWWWLLSPDAEAYRADPVAVRSGRPTPDPARSTRGRRGCRQTSPAAAVERLGPGCGSWRPRDSLEPWEELAILARGGVQRAGPTSWRLGWSARRWHEGEQRELDEHNDQDPLERLRAERDNTAGTSPGGGGRSTGSASGGRDAARRPGGLDRRGRAGGLPRLTARDPAGAAGRARRGSAAGAHGGSPTRHAESAERCRTPREGVAHARDQPLPRSLGRRTAGGLLAALDAATDPAEIAASLREQVAVNDERWTPSARAASRYATTSDLQRKAAT